MKKLLFLLVLLAAPLFAQSNVNVGLSIGGDSGYKFPYVEALIEGRHQFATKWDNDDSMHRLHAFGEFRVASARKVDTGDGTHIAGRGGLAWAFQQFSVGAGVSAARQYTSLYQKGFVQPFVTARYDADFAVYDFYYIEKGTDHRNGQRTFEFRTTWPVADRWSVRVGGELNWGYQTDRPSDKITTGGGMFTILYTLHK